MKITHHIGLGIHNSKEKISTLAKSIFIAIFSMFNILCDVIYDTVDKHGVNWYNKTLIRILQVDKGWGAVNTME